MPKKIPSRSGYIKRRNFFIILIISLFFAFAIYSIIYAHIYSSNARWLGPVIIGFFIILFNWFFCVRSAIKKYKVILISEIEYPVLYKFAREFSEKLNISIPKIGIMDTHVPAAFTIGRSFSNSIVVVSIGLVNILTDQELKAVLAHEFSHIVNGDSSLVTWLQGFWLFGRLMYHPISRYSEFIADEDGVRMTGHPDYLISALTKLGGWIPDDSIKNNIFDSHPRLKQRIERLRTLEKEFYHG